MIDKMEYGSAYLYAEDLLSDGEFSKVEVTIEKVHPAGTLKRADGKMIDKPALAFFGKDKLLVLCKSNIAFLKYATGDALPAKWVGRKVTLVVRRVEAFGDKVPAIRIWPGCPIRRGLVKYLGDPLPRANSGDPLPRANSGDPLPRANSVDEKKPNAPLVAKD